MAPRSAATLSGGHPIVRSATAKMARHRQRTPAFQGCSPDMAQVPHRAPQTTPSRGGSFAFLGVADRRGPYLLCLLLIYPAFRAVTRSEPLGNDATAQGTGPTAPAPAGVPESVLLFRPPHRPHDNSPEN